MASVGLLFDQAALAVSAIRRGDEVTDSRLAALRELHEIVAGVAELESVPLGQFQANALRSNSDLERLEALSEARPSDTGIDWVNLRDLLGSALEGKTSPTETDTLRETLVGLARASLSRTAQMVDWRPRAGDQWNDLRLSSL